jgi:hypothetical protein
VAATLYKARGMSTKSEVCAICVERTRGKTVNVDLGRGVHVWLCQAHASDEFRRRRSGRDFVLTLHRLWSAHGCLTKPRSRALDDHLAAMRSEPRSPRHRPGSYAWANLRAEAEQRFFDGEDPARVIVELRDRHAPDYAQVPTARTMRRWFHERRWLRQKPVLEISTPGMPIDRRTAGQSGDPPPTTQNPPAARPQPHVRPQAPQEPRNPPPTTLSASQNRCDRPPPEPPRPPPEPRP